VFGIFSVSFFSLCFDGFMLDLVFRFRSRFSFSSSDLFVSADISISHHFCADQPLSLVCACLRCRASPLLLLVEICLFLVFSFLFVFCSCCLCLWVEDVCCLLTFKVEEEVDRCGDYLSPLKK
jgi:hypothetical protein